MNKLTQDSSHENNGAAAELTGRLGEAVREIVASSPPAGALDRALARARLVEPPHPKKERSLRWRAQAILALAASCALVFGTGYLLVRPRVSLAAVANALAEQMWIHVSTTEPDGRRDETWFSPDRRITAGRTPDWIELHDDAMQVYYSYDVKEETLYRVPQPESRGPGLNLLVFDSIRALAAEYTSDPIGKLQFLPTDEKSKLTLVSQKRRTLREAGRTWQEVELSLGHERWEEPARVVFRIDAQTHLPSTWRCEYKTEGKWRVIESRFDYPQPGPHDIYDLGVPRTAKLVDRIPRGDVARLLAGVREERNRMDDYACLMLQRTDDNEYWWNAAPFRVYHKGKRYRYEFAFPLEPTEKPAEDIDLGEWWRERSKQIWYRPQSIVTGGKQYQCEFEGFKDASGRMASRVKAVKETPVVRHGEEWFPAHYSWTPEFAARFPLAVGGQVHEASADLNASGGPPGAVLLSVGRKGRAPGAEKANVPSRVTIPNGYRFWIAPERGHLVLRTEFLNDRGEPTHQYTIEKMARSPSGQWYPEVIRTETEGPGGDKAEKIKARLLFYVDFGAELPEELFEPPYVGQVFYAPTP